MTTTPADRIPFGQVAEASVESLRPPMRMNETLSPLPGSPSENPAAHFVIEAIERSPWEARVAVASTYEEVIAFLRRSGLERIAARLDYLRQVVDEDSEHPPMQIESLRSLAHVSRCRTPASSPTDFGRSGWSSLGPMANAPQRGHGVGIPCFRVDSVCRAVQAW